MTSPDEPTATTAGEENHEDPWAFAGDDADAPGDLGRTDDTPDTPRDHAAIAAAVDEQGGA